jgi:hypothetical protein
MSDTGTVTSSVTSHVLSGGFRSRFKALPPISSLLCLTAALPKLVYFAPCSSIFRQFILLSFPTGIFQEFHLALTSRLFQSIRCVASRLLISPKASFVSRGLRALLALHQGIPSPYRTCLKRTTSAAPSPHHSSSKTIYFSLSSLAIFHLSSAATSV